MDGTWPPQILLQKFLFVVSYKNCGHSVSFIVFLLFIARNIPFRVGVVFNDEEICSDADASIACEADLIPGGIVGFALGYAQKSC